MIDKQTCVPIQVDLKKDFSCVHYSSSSYPTSVVTDHAVTQVTNGCNTVM